MSTYNQMLYVNLFSSLVSLCGARLLLTKIMRPANNTELANSKRVSQKLCLMGWCEQALYLQDSFGLPLPSLLGTQRHFIPFLSFLSRRLWVRTPSLLPYTQLHIFTSFSQALELSSQRILIQTVQ